MRYKIIGQGLGIEGLLRSVLKNRGIVDIEQFLNLGEWNIEEETLYDNIELGAECLLNHIKNGSRIAIIVDSDADGFTSGAMMYQYINVVMKHLGLEYGDRIIAIIHEEKGHGLDKEIMARLEKESYDLVILPDSSSNDYEQHSELKNKGVDILVIDHHQSDKYSEHAIVINNQLSDRVTNKAMTGVGVVYKLCKVLDKKLGMEMADKFLDLVALGMIADSCDLRDLESRYLVNKGVALIEEKKGLNKLIASLAEIQAYSLKNEVTIMGVAFYIAPLVNSVIRAGSMEEKLYLFRGLINEEGSVVTTIRGKGEVRLEFSDYVARMCSSIKRRQDGVVKKGVEDLVAQVQGCALDSNCIIMANATGVLDKNYTGLVANKMANLYQRPTLLLREQSSGDVFGGSARGYERGSHIGEFKTWCEKTGLFNYTLGHENAFGVEITRENLNKLFLSVGDIEFKTEEVHRVDAVFDDKTLNKTVVETIGRLKKTWGTTVYEPLFAIEKIVINSNDIKCIGKNNNTLKFTYKGIDFIQFNVKKEVYDELIIKEGILLELTIVGRFSINEFNGNVTPQIVISDIESREKKVFSFS